jgi:hypothetical protein
MTGTTIALAPAPRAVAGARRSVSFENAAAKRRRRHVPRNRLQPSSTLRSFTKRSTRFPLPVCWRSRRAAIEEKFAGILLSKVDRAKTCESTIGAASS